MSKERLVEILSGYYTEGGSGNFVYYFTDEEAEDIADYLLANGVIVPPCKVGDTVFYFSHRPFNLALQANKIYEARVVRMVTTKLGTSLVIQIRDEFGVTEVPQVTDFGKTVFLTREEAEAKLKEKKDDEC